MVITIMTTSFTTTTEHAGEAALLRLMAWLSPAFPVGSFSYSHGLERAVHDGQVQDAASLADWIDALLICGSAWNDAVVLAESWRKAGSGTTPHDEAELAQAMAGSLQRHRESTLQGNAFLKAAASWGGGIRDELPEDCPYCVAVGALAGYHGIDLETTLAAFLQAFATNQLQAAIRLSVIGQGDAVATLARLERPIIETAARAAASTLDDLGSATILAEIAAMKHETLYSRLFRS
ncbi:urease accessory protein UreF [Mesorhizobium sp. CAU 1741]|uniref:urease accessory protein UreF n=1 Tax=Mesorhizobium sp. CAU 1741 TaxID=3140366 RepID=UPI00325BC5AE